MWGHVKAFTRKGSSYQMKFDPGWWLTGTAAEHARARGHRLADVPNDVYTLEEGHRLLTFTVLRTRPHQRADRAGRVAARHARPVRADPAGKNPTGHRIFEPQAGYWLRISEKYPNPAVTIDQQYQP